MPDARAVPIGSGHDLRCLVCGATAFWRRYPKAVDRTDQLVLLAEDAAQDVRELRNHQTSAKPCHRWSAVPNPDRRRSDAGAGAWRDGPGRAAVVTRATAR